MGVIKAVSTLLEVSSVTALKAIYSMKITSLVMVMAYSECKHALADLYTAINLDINECNLNLSMCQPDSFCNNTIGSYLCICNVGYSGNGFINCTSKFNYVRCLSSYQLLLRC